MSMIATITSITQQAKAVVVGVTFSDAQTLFSANDVFTVADPANTTQADVVALIQAKGQEYKASQTAVAGLQSKVGFVINIT